MFREIVRFKQALPEEECLELLKNEKRGVLSVLGDDDYPYGMPVNHYYCEEDGRLYFHGGRSGHKIEAMRRHGKVSFCVMEDGTAADGQWWKVVRSVIVFGHVEFIEDREKMQDITRRLSYKFTDDEAYIDYEIEHSGPGTLLFALVPEHMTGKRVNER